MGINGILYMGMAGYGAEQINTISSELSVQKSYVVITKEQQPSDYKNAECLQYVDLIYAEFENYQHLVGRIKPVDDDVLCQISSKLVMILKIQQRYEKHGRYRTPNTLDYYYGKMMNTILFFNTFLEQCQIEQVVFGSVPHEGFDNIVYELCRIKGIAVCMLYESSIPGRKRVLSDYVDLEKALASEFLQLQNQYKDKDIDEIILEDDTKDFFERMQHANEGRSVAYYQLGASFERMFRIKYGERRYIQHVCNDIYQHTNQFNSRLIRMVMNVVYMPVYVRNLLQKRKKIQFANQVYRESVDLHRVYQEMAESPREENYIYYAMHYMPELTSAPLGGGLYMDQSISIGILAHSMPVDWKLYVKIHPTQLTNTCSIKLFQDINKMDNVMLIKEEVAVYDLIANAKAVATLTGTAAWEAQFFNIPAIVFGYSEKNVAPLSYKVRTVKECEAAIANILDENKHTDIKELKIFTKAMEHISFRSEEDIIIKQIINFCQKER